MTDEELVERHIEGDETVFPILISRYVRPMYTFVYRLTGSDESQDIVQDIFIKVWKKIKKFDNEKRFKAWIFTIARNTAFDWLRKRKVVVFSEEDRLGGDADVGDGFAESLVDDMPLPDDTFANAELGKLLEQALGTLSLSQRVVVILHAVDELTFEEVAQVTGVPMNTVKSQYRRAVAALKKYIMHQNSWS